MAHTAYTGELKRQPPSGSFTVFRRDGQDFPGWDHSDSAARSADLAPYMNDEVAPGVLDKLEMGPHCEKQDQHDTLSIYSVNSAGDRLSKIRDLERDNTKEPASSSELQLSHRVFGSILMKLYRNDTNTSFAEKL